MESVSVCYVAGVTESEAGWGNRPDGYVIGWDKELMEAWFKERGDIISGDAREYSRVDLPLQMKIVTDAGKDLVSKEQTLYESGQSKSGRPFLWIHRIEQYVRK